MTISTLSTPQGVSVFLLDEHHEAYLAWWLFFSGLRSNGPRVLVHIDEHADFGLPALTKPLPLGEATKRTVEEFVYRQLSIGTFLIPAAASRFFSDLVWVRPSRELLRYERTVDLYLSSGPPYISFIPTNGVRTSFSYRTEKLGQLQSHDENWMLDICLDSFSCNKRLTPEPFLLEITPEQYHDMNKPRLNPWNMRYGSAAKTFLRGGRHYFELDIAGWSPPEMFGSQASTERRFQRFSNFLAKVPCLPLNVTISRSIRSGYLPRDVASSIEERVISLLNKHF